MEQVDKSPDDRGWCKGFMFLGSDRCEQGYHMRHGGIGTDAFSMEAADQLYWPHFLAWCVRPFVVIKWRLNGSEKPRSHPKQVMCLSLLQPKPVMVGGQRSTSVPGGESRLPRGPIVGLRNACSIVQVMVSGWTGIADVLPRFKCQNTQSGLCKDLKKKKKQVVFYCVFNDCFFDSLPSVKAAFLCGLSHALLAREPKGNTAKEGPDFLESKRAGCGCSPSVDIGALNLKWFLWR